MKIETERSKQVSDQELIQIIANTKREIEAYEKLVDRYTTLASLPEEMPDEKRIYKARAIEFESAKRGCENFLKFLQNLRKERGI